MAKSKERNAQPLAEPPARRRGRPVGATDPTKPLRAARTQLLVKLVELGAARAAGAEGASAPSIEETIGLGRTGANGRKTGERWRSWRSHPMPTDTFQQVAKKAQAVGWLDEAAMGTLKLAYAPVAAIERATEVVQARYRESLEFDKAMADLDRSILNLAQLQGRLQYSHIHDLGESDFRLVRVKRSRDDPLHDPAPSPYVSSGAFQARQLQRVADRLALVFGRLGDGWLTFLANPPFIEGTMSLKEEIHFEPFPPDEQATFFEPAPCTFLGSGESAAISRHLPGESKSTPENSAAEKRRQIKKI